MISTESAKAEAGVAAPNKAVSSNATSACWTLTRRSVRLSTAQRKKCGFIAVTISTVILGSALNVVLYIVFGAMAVGFAGVVLCWIGLMIFGAVTWPVFKVRRWYRVIEDAGDNYDFDGLRVHRDADFDPYYVRKYNVLLPLPHLGRGFLTNDATWCAAYNGRSEEIWITRRTREPRRLPRRLRNIEDLEELRPKLRELDRLAFPWRYSEDDDYERAGVGE